MNIFVQQGEEAEEPKISFFHSLSIPYFSILYLMIRRDIPKSLAALACTHPCNCSLLVFGRGWLCSIRFKDGIYFSLVP